MALSTPMQHNRRMAQTIADFGARLRLHQFRGVSVLTALRTGGNPNLTSAAMGDGWGFWGKRRQEHILNKGSDRAARDMFKVRRIRATFRRQNQPKSGRTLAYIVFSPSAGFASKGKGPSNALLRVTGQSLANHELPYLPSLLSNKTRN